MAGVRVIEVLVLTCFILALHLVDSSHQSGSKDESRHGSLSRFCSELHELAKNGLFWNSKIGHFSLYFESKVTCAYCLQLNEKYGMGRQRCGGRRMGYDALAPLYTQLFCAYDTGTCVLSIKLSVMQQFGCMQTVQHKKMGALQDG